MGSSHVIVGSGPAGVIAAETIRRLAPRDDIVLVGDEPGPPYSRMAIPYLLAGHIGEDGTWLRKDPAHFEAERIARETARAESVDTAARTVTLAGGRTLAYHALLVATGSRPVRPPIPGIDLAGVHPCWTLADARAIMALAKPGARVVQMGAGFIGCIIMEALAARGVALTVVEMGDRLVPRMMGPGAAAIIRRWVEAKGVGVRTSAGVEAIERVGRSLTIRLADGATLDADLVIVATGVMPNIDFLLGSGITCSVGVTADDHMETNVPGVFAAGDCAEALDLASGRHVVSAIQPNAADQGYCAAMNMTGRRAALPAVTQINVLDTLGLVSASFGNWQGAPGGDHVELSDARSTRYVRLEFDGDVLVGANSVGLTQHLGVMRGLIESRVRLGPWKDRLVKNPLALMEAYLATAQQQAGPGH